MKDNGVTSGTAFTIPSNNDEEVEGQVKISSRRRGRTGGGSLIKKKVQPTTQSSQESNLISPSISTSPTGYNETETKSDFVKIGEKQPTTLNTTSSNENSLFGSVKRQENVQNDLKIGVSDNSHTTKPYQTGSLKEDNYSQNSVTAEDGKNVYNYTISGDNAKITIVQGDSHNKTFVEKEGVYDEEPSINTKISDFDDKEIIEYLITLMLSDNKEEVERFNIMYKDLSNLYLTHTRLSSIKNTKEGI